MSRVEWMRPIALWQRIPPRVAQEDVAVSVLAVRSFNLLAEVVRPIREGSKVNSRLLPLLMDVFHRINHVSFVDFGPAAIEVHIGRAIVREAARLKLRVNEIRRS